MSVSEELRKAIKSCGFNFKQIETETGVDRSSIARFTAGERGLHSDAIDKLAQFFQLRLVEVAPLEQMLKLLAQVVQETPEKDLKG